MYLESLSRNLDLAWTTNCNQSAFSNPLPTLTAPTAGSGWVLASSLALNPGVVPSRLRLYPIGVGNANDVFSMRVWALYHRLSSSGLHFYLPVPVLEVSCTLGAYAGIASAEFTTTTLFADTITIVKEPVTTANTTNDGTTVVWSPANDTPAWVEIDSRAAIGHYFDFDQTTNTPTMNCLVSRVN